jgi:pyridoxal 5'-phosphate synthase pdxS subunit
MIRTKGEAGTGDIVEAVNHMRKIMSQIRRVTTLADDEIMAEAKRLQAPYELLKEVHRLGRLPVVNFAAGGVATPADAALMMHLGAEGVFVGSGIFKADDPEVRAKAIVEAVTHYQNDDMLAQISRPLGEPMRGIAVEQMAEEELLAKRGW